MGKPWVIQPRGRFRANSAAFVRLGDVALEERNSAWLPEVHCPVSGWSIAATIAYLPERPGQARIDSKRELWGNTIGAVVAIVLFFVAALVSSGLGWFGVF